MTEVCLPYLIADPALQWRSLQRENLSTQQHAYAEGTLKNIAGHWKAYFLFCYYFKVEPVPISANDLACFIQFMSRHIKSHQTLLILVSHVRLLHACYGVDFMPTQFLQIKGTLAGLRRISCSPPSPKLPITPKILRDIYGIMDFSIPLHLVSSTVFVVAFFAFLRKSNLVPDTYVQASSGKGHYLHRRDLLILQDAAVLTIKSSKTDHFREKSFKIPLAAEPGNDLCPVSALKTMITRIPAELSRPAFLIPDSVGQLKPLIYPALTQFLKECLSRIGLNPKLYAMHSFRRGGCTHGHAMGIDSDSLKLHGNWLSNAYQAYLSPDLSTRLQVSKIMLAGI